MPDAKPPLQSGLTSDATPAHFEVVREGEYPRRRRGRPLVLTPRRFIRVCQAIEQGLTTVEACELESVSYRTLRLRVQYSPVFEKRLKKAEKIRLEVWRAYHLRNLNKKAQTSWQASAWVLERNFPDEFALRHVERPSENKQAEVLVDKIPMEELIEMHRLAGEIAKQAPQYGLP